MNARLMMGESCVAACVSVWRASLSLLRSLDVCACLRRCTCARATACLSCLPACLSACLLLLSPSATLFSCCCMAFFRLPASEGFLDAAGIPAAAAAGAGPAELVSFSLSSVRVCVLLLLLLLLVLSQESVCGYRVASRDGGRRREQVLYVPRLHAPCVPLLIQWHTD